MAAIALTSGAVRPSGAEMSGEQLGTGWIVRILNLSLCHRLEEAGDDRLPFSHRCTRASRNQQRLPLLSKAIF